MACDVGNKGKPEQLRLSKQIISMIAHLQEESFPRLFGGRCPDEPFKRLHILLGLFKKEFSGIIQDTLAETFIFGGDMNRQPESFVQQRSKDAKGFVFPDFFRAHIESRGKVLASSARISRTSRVRRSGSSSRNESLRLRHGPL